MPVPPEVMIAWRTGDGEERDERWPSLDRFLAWARADAVRCTWTCYEPDEDGEWVLIARGRIG